MSALELLTQGDAISRAVALLLLLMSVASWVVILWKAWLLRGGTRDVLRGVGALWQAATLDEAAAALPAFDRAGLVQPSVAALRQWADASPTQAQAAPLSATATATRIAARANPAQHLTRLLRDALHTALRRLQAGQILLATVGATAPFVGLLGTVWGIHRALATIATQTGGFTIDKVAGPVGEALVMTALGLAVAIPAVLAYNVFGRVVGRIEAELEGFAHDLLAVFAADAPLAPPARPMPVANA